jgi:hypothetical protein
MPSPEKLAAAQAFIDGLDKRLNAPPERYVDSLEIRFDLSLDGIAEWARGWPRGRIVAGPGMSPVAGHWWVVIEVES